MNEKLKINSMWTSDKIEQFCKDFGFNPFSTQAEIKELPNLLHPDEQLLGLLEGYLKNILGYKVNGQGIVIATNQRVIFFRKSFFGTITKREISLSEVTSASYWTGLIFGSIFITAANYDSVVRSSDQKASEKFVKVLLDLVNNFQRTPSQQPLDVQNDSILILEKLFELKQKGILSEDEYNQQKTKILNT